MKNRVLVGALCAALAAVSLAHSQTDAAPTDAAVETRYSLGVIDDATFYSDQAKMLPSTLNRVLLEPSFAVRYRNRYSLSTSLIGNTTTHYGTATQMLVREAYAGISAGDLDLTAGRKLVRWGTGYAFTAAGVLDPPRVATDPSDRLNLNEGRDMLKADLVHGKHAATLAWSTAALARRGSHMHDTVAFRYNVLVFGFDSAMIAGSDRKGDSFGALTFTRVLGQAWEAHGEMAWREHPAVVMGGKYTMHNGITCIGEVFTAPNTPYYRHGSVSPTAGRQNYAFLNASKSRLLERPGWKEWDISGGMVANLGDRSVAGVLDVSRWFGKHVSAYTHLELPSGSSHSDYGSAPYRAATSLGIRFHL